MQMNLRTSSDGALMDTGWHGSSADHACAPAPGRTSQLWSEAQEQGCLRAVAAGDPVAFEQFYHYYTPRLAETEATVRSRLRLARQCLAHALTRQGLGPTTSL
jgi:hypothetical protein